MPKTKFQNVIFTLMMAFLMVYVQILPERYAYSEISGTSILI